MHVLETANASIEPPKKRRYNTCLNRPSTKRYEVDDNERLIRHERCEMHRRNMQNQLNKVTLRSAGIAEEGECFQDQSFLPPDSAA
jgi:hypothetical protein